MLEGAGPTPRLHSGPGNWFCARMVVLGAGRGKPPGSVRLTFNVLIKWRCYSLLCGQISHRSNLRFPLFPGSWKRPFLISFQKGWCRFSTSAVGCVLLAVAAGQEQLCRLRCALPQPRSPAALTSNSLCLGTSNRGSRESVVVVRSAQDNLRAAGCPLRHPGSSSLTGTGLLLFVLICRAFSPRGSQDRTLGEQGPVQHWELQENPPSTTSHAWPEFLSCAADNIKPRSWSAVFFSSFLLASHKLILVFQQTSPGTCEPGWGWTHRRRPRWTTRVGIAAEPQAGKSLCFTSSLANRWFPSGLRGVTHKAACRCPPLGCPHATSVCLHWCPQPAQLPTNFMSHAFPFPSSLAFGVSDHFCRILTLSQNPLWTVWSVGFYFFSPLANFGGFVCSGDNSQFSRIPGYFCCGAREGGPEAAHRNERAIKAAVTFASFCWYR